MSAALKRLIREFNLDGG